MIVLINTYCIKTTFFDTGHRVFDTKYGKLAQNALPSKGGFFSESAMRFLDLQKKLFQKTILSLKLNFKLRIGFWNIFFVEILISEKRTALYSEKSHLYLFLINYVVNKRKSNNVVKSVYNGNLSHILQHLIQVKYQKNLSETFECTKNKIF